jgi:hypothetical protein
MMSPSHLTTQDQVKCIATLCGDSISHAVSNSQVLLPVINQCVLKGNTVKVKEAAECGA